MQIQHSTAISQRLSPQAGHKTRSHTELASVFVPDDLCQDRDILTEQLDDGKLEMDNVLAADILSEDSEDESPETKKDGRLVVKILWAVPVCILACFLSGIWKLNR